MHPVLILAVQRTEGCMEGATTLGVRVPEGYAEAAGAKHVEAFCVVLLFLLAVRSKRMCLASAEPPKARSICNALHGRRCYMSQSC